VDAVAEVDEIDCLGVDGGDGLRLEFVGRHARSVSDAQRVSDRAMEA
jgi:hypothetical protein